MEEETALSSVWRYLRVVLLIDLIIFVVVGASFLFIGEFTIRAYGERLFWAGIGAMIVGGFSAMSVGGAAQMYGVTNILTAGPDARNVHHRMADVSRTIFGRYKFTFRMGIIGAVCMITSALIEILSR